MGTLNFEAVVDDEEEPPESDAGVEFERIPLPGWLKKRLMKALLRDVHHYLYNTEHTPRPGETFFVQDEIRRRMTEALVAGEEQAGDGAHIVVSHSMGTVIAYDCLKRVPGVPRVDALVTIGSPLGLDEIQDALQPGWTRADGFPSTRVSGPWYNVFDRLDPVAGFDPELANDYLLSGAESVKDVSEASYGKWRHSISKYLGQPHLRDVLSELLDL
jgi:pimeloyl-ACP methyl ester carboxylesterase